MIVTLLSLLEQKYSALRTDEEREAFINRLIHLPMQKDFDLTERTVDVCPSCGSTDLRRAEHTVYPFYSEIRYFCRACHKSTFVRRDQVGKDLRGSSERWKVFFSTMLGSRSLRKGIRASGITYDTYRRWQRRLFTAVRANLTLI